MKQGLVRLLYNCGKRFMGWTLHMIMCVLCYPVSIHMSQLLSTGCPISSWRSITEYCSGFLLLHVLANTCLIFISCLRPKAMAKRLSNTFCMCVHPFFTFCINLNISFTYRDIFTKFAGNVYGYENSVSAKMKNKMATIANCLKIIKVL